MTLLHRRAWLKQSLLASSAVALPSIRDINLCRPKLDLPEGEKKFIRLNWNENPYGPSPSAREAISRTIERANHYPDDLLRSLKQKLADKYGYNTSNVLVTSGSTEILCLLGQLAGLDGGEILTPWPSFPTIVLFGQRCGASQKRVELGEGEVIDLNRVKDKITRDTRIVFICNPNNPTSTEVDNSDLRSFCQSVPKDVLICVDEAYIEFSSGGEQSSLVDMVSELPNLVICRTFSKAYGLAGLRIGYAISSSRNIRSLQSRHIGLDFNIGATAVASALVSMDDQEFVSKCVQETKKGRKIVYTAFDKWGVEYAQSATNFVYAKSRHFVPDVVDQLKSNHILITKWPDMKEHIRISIQTPDEMSQFVHVVEKYLA